MDRLALITGGAHPMGIGYEVIVTGISEDEIGLTPPLPGLSTRVMDVTSDASVAAVVAALPRLDALVNCAGAANLAEFEMEGFARTVEVNLAGTMRFCLQAYPLLARQGGAVVTVGSIYSSFGSAMAPGWIRTNLSRMLWENEDCSAPIVARTPMGRWGDLQELDDVIGFLCAPASRFVSGTLIPVDGAYSVSG